MDELPSDKKLGISLIDTIASNELPDLSKEIIELTLDAVMEEGILKDIPIVSTIVALTKTTIALRDRALIKKLLRFLREVNGATPKEKERFLLEIDEEEGGRQEFGEKLLLLLDRLDDIRKSAMVGTLFSAYLRDDITLKEFNRFSSIIEKVYLDDLIGLSECVLIEERSQTMPYGERLYHLGLSEIEYVSRDNSTEILSRRALRNIWDVPTSKVFVFYPSAIARVMSQILFKDMFKDKNFIKDYKEFRSFRSYS